MSDDKESTASLEEWAADAKARIDAFVAWWREEAALAPTLFPDRMPLGEWDEQYRSAEGG